MRFERGCEVNEPIVALERSIDERSCKHPLQLIVESFRERIANAEIATRGGATSECAPDLLSDVVGELQHIVERRPDERWLHHRGLTERFRERQAPATRLADRDHSLTTPSLVDSRGSEVRVVRDVLSKAAREIVERQSTARRVEHNRKRGRRRCRHNLEKRGWVPEAVNRSENQFIAGERDVGQVATEDREESKDPVQLKCRGDGRETAGAIDDDARADRPAVRQESHRGRFPFERQQLCAIENDHARGATTFEENNEDCLFICDCNITDRQGRRAEERRNAEMFGCGYHAVFESVTCKTSLRRCPEFSRRSCQGPFDHNDASTRRQVLRENETGRTAADNRDVRVEMLLVDIDNP